MSRPGASGGAPDGAPDGVQGGAPDGASGGVPDGASGQTLGKAPGETTGHRRGPRPRRAAAQPPTRLPGEGAHGVVRGWEAGSSLQEAEEATLRATEALRARREAAQGNEPGTEPERAPLLEQRPAGESEAAWGDPDGAAEDAARAAWIKSQRPPHWG